MSSTLIIALPLLALYIAFLLWYGGRGKPLSEAELLQFERELGALGSDAQGHSASELVRLLAAMTLSSQRRHAA